MVHEDMLFTEISIFISGDHFVQWSRTILSILEDSIIGNICMKLFCLGGEKIMHDE